jgi:putative flippase GtrA
MTSFTNSAKRPIVFLGVGILNTLIDFLFYTLLVTFVFTSTEHIALAGILSGTFALFCAFVTHSLITWKGSKKNIKSVILFILFTGFGMWVIRPLLLSVAIGFTAIYSWVTELLNSIGIMFSFQFIANTLAFGIMTIILLIYNYVIYNYVVFKTNSSNR